MTFLQLLQTLEERMGRIHWPLRSQAVTVHELFEGCGLHHELVLTLARAIYAENRCHHLKDRVTVEATLRAIGPIHAAVLHADHTDIDTYRFLESFVATIQAIFGQKPPPRRVPPARKVGQVLLFPIRRRAAH